MKRFILSACVVAALALCHAVAQEPEADPLVLKSEWKGKLTQKGKIMGVQAPPEFEVVLVVTQRKDKDFECELREKLPDGAHVTYLCKGKVLPVKAGTSVVTFESVGVKAANEGFVPVTRVPYTGTVIGNVLKGTWRVPLNKIDDTELEGEFNLQKQQVLSKEVN
jgi:hypothetical protein